jgi:hypothetical protein
MTPVTAEAQLEFLRNIQRVLSDGRFTATYKYALIYALADLCVSKGDDTGEPLTLSTRDIAERFLALYERQSIDFPGTDHVLLQNHGRQAAIVNYIREARAQYSARSRELRRHQALISRIDRTVREMPLGKLQTVAGETRPFLYDQPTTGQHEITLYPGVAACFRTFYPLIVATIQGAWVRAVRGLNPEVFQDPTDLHAFMFGTPRADLQPYREVLTNIQDGRCFYTGRRLDAGSAVDHFIPWSRYPYDLGHNFVLASADANAAKRDNLASERHLERWIEQVDQHRATLDSAFESQGLPHSWPGSLKVAQWAYSMAESTMETVWQSGTTRVALEGVWEGLISAALRSFAE